MRLLTGDELRAKVAAIAGERKPCCAVAFWGRGAAALFGPRSRVRIVCNLATGGTNPDEIIALQAKGHTVLQHDQLHAKVYLGKSQAVVASANASANGLGLEASEQAKWIEAGWPARLLRTTAAPCPGQGGDRTGRDASGPTYRSVPARPVTGRCRRQTGHKGGRSLIAKARMRSHLVVVPTPAFDQNPSLGPGAEPLHVQAFVAELAIEALADAILPRQCPDGSAPFRSSACRSGLHQRLRDELRAVVRPQKPGRTALAYQPRQHLDHTRRS